MRYPIKLCTVALNQGIISDMNRIKEILQSFRFSLRGKTRKMLNFRLIYRGLCEKYKQKQRGKCEKSCISVCRTGI